MGIFKRMGHVFSANLNDLIDQCENPEKMLRQAVREMEGSLGRLMDSAARAIAHQRLLTTELEKQQREIDRFLRTAEEAVARGDDEAARRALRHKSERQRLADGLTRQVTTAEALSQRLRNQVTTMRIGLAEARQKLLDLTARSRAAAAWRKFSDSRLEGSGETVNFERLSARVEQEEAETEALLELLGESDSTESWDTEIEAELRALKEKACHVAH